jgi:hypothetical protein
MRATILAVGDGGLGFWSALRKVFPTARAQRCWFHLSGDPAAPWQLAVRAVDTGPPLTPQTAALLVVAAERLADTDYQEVVRYRDELPP